MINLQVKIIDKLYNLLYNLISGCKKKIADRR